MSRLIRLTTLVVVLAACSDVRSEDTSCNEPGKDCFLKRLAPAGGWCPDSGGLLHWWQRNCFPRWKVADDYCRKPAPCVCWPPYPPYYRWDAPQTAPAWSPDHGK